MTTNAAQQNPYTNELVDNVLNNYGLIPENLITAQSGQIKTIWRFSEKSMEYCLKRLRHPYDRALFSVNAQIFIHKSGGNVPQVILNKHGRAITEHNSQLFVLYEWLNGRDLDLKNSNDLSLAIKGLAKFHISSKGYKPVSEARTSTKMGKWPEQYDSIKVKLTAWKEIARDNIHLPCHSSYLKFADSMILICEKCRALLEKSSYTGIISSLKDPPLCHQDFGNGNVLFTKSGVYVIDLDGVTFDLPARDLRKIIGKSAENKNLWELRNINKITEWYTGINPLSPEELKILYIDLMYPHWFFGLMKNLYQNNKMIKPGEIEKISRLEQSKVPLLTSLLKEGA